MASQRRQVWYSGDVQGVGFRYTTVRTAGRFDVTGYVRNLPDGRVECVVEGEAKEIDAFLDALADRMGGHIRERSEQTAPYRGAFDGFGVRH